MILIFFGFSTQLGRILPCVTLTKSFGYLWDLLCYPHTPPHTHVRCEKSSIGPENWDKRSYGPDVALEGPI